MAIKALTTNTLATSPHYQRIMTEYNELYKRNGRVNASKFYREVVRPLIPNYSRQSFYNFLHRFRTSTGLALAVINNAMPGQLPKGSAPYGIDVDAELEHNMMSNQMATTLGIARMLNIGADALQELINDPTKMSVRDRVELLLKAMKAQDSRMSAVSKIREDTRSQARFDREFEDVASGV